MTTQQLAVIVLAAGAGTRMKSRLPKVLHRIGGRTLLGHVLETAQQLDAVTVRVIVRHERDQVVESIRDYPGVQAVDQDDLPGTGRAVQLGVASLPESFDGTVLVLSADVPLLDRATLGALLDEHGARHAAATVLSARVSDPTGYGRIIRDADGAVTGIVEQRDATDEQRMIDEINAGVYAFSASSLRAALPHLSDDNAQHELYLTEVVSILRRAGQPVAATTAPDATAALGVNDRAQLAEAAAILRDRTTRRWQSEGVSILDPATTWIDDTVTLAPDVTVLPNTFLLGATTIAAGATLGPDTSVVDSEVGADAEIRRSDVTTSVIGPGATVGPFTHIRAGSILSENVKIGAFAETKNSTFGGGVKVPHLSYVGDSDVGTGTNLGAGTITANYDDIAKHRTTIADDVHTGAHTVLVAPVRLGAGAKTAAGAVIRKDVEPGALAMSVAPQRNITGWVQQNRAGTASAQSAQRAEQAEMTGDGA